jgi:ribosomal subunit interface protein
MQIETRGNVELSPALEQYVQRRFQVALRRFDKRLPLVVVRLTDVNGPKGGVDKRCHVTLPMPPSTPILVEEHHADLYTAIDFAAERVSRAVTRELGRRRVKRTIAAELRNRERTGFSQRQVAVS